jgi:hypothetical protein
LFIFSTYHFLYEWMNGSLVCVVWRS